MPGQKDPKRIKKGRAKPPLCPYCQRSFSRAEHLQRHVRSHTNDKPFSCDICSKSFGRNDLMIRHKRLVHPPPPLLVHGQNEGLADRRQTPLDVIPIPAEHSIAAIHSQNMLPWVEQSLQIRERDWEHPIEANSNVQRLDSFDEESIPCPIMKPIEDPMQNFADFIESIGFSEGWAPDGLQSIDQFILPFDPVAALQTEFRNDTTTTDDVEDHSSHGHVPEENFLSNFGSRLPSLQPESGEQEDRSQRSGGAIGIQLTRNIREADYRSFLKGLNYFQCVLPGDFSAPSKFKLSRFFHGFIDGLNEHLPFIHTPTLRIGSCNPALVLAIAACGAQYRFEGEEGLTLFCAAQAIILEILRQRSYGTSPNLLSSSLLSTCRGVAGFWSHSPDRSEQESAELMEAMQAILLLVIHATWGGDARAAQESMTLQGNLASLVRVHGLGEKPAFEITDRTNDVDWCRWAKEESNRRTKFVVFCFLNLHSLMHNTPPLILNSDLGLNMPCSAEVWTAQNASAWGLVYEKAQNRKHSCFQESISLLFKAKESSAGGEMACTAFGNHILLHALSQQLFFARQLCRLPLEQGTHRHHITGMDAVLRTWKSYWKQTPESSTDPRNPSGPIAFTSAALLGQIYVRLQIDLGPHRALMTRDPSAIAQALAGAPNDVFKISFSRSNFYYGGPTTSNTMPVTTMKALNYVGPYDVQVQDVEKPRLEHPDDIIVKITSAAICGSDLHMYEGRTAAKPGITFGHENMGIVQELGSGVTLLKKGDRVVMPFNVADGRCRNCEEGKTAFCTGVNPGFAGGAYGQAQYLRVPFADFNALLLPPADTQIRISSLPAGTESKFLDLYQAKALLFSVQGPLDRVEERLQVAQSIGCIPIDFTKGDAVDQITSHNNGMVDRSVDAVGYQAVDSNGSSEKANIVLENMIRVTRACGGMGVPGLYVPSDPGSSDANSANGIISLSFGKLFEKGLSLRTGQCNVKAYNRYLRDIIIAGKAKPSFVISHEIDFADAAMAYEKFDKKESGYTKVLIHPNGGFDDHR
ncbi:transcriptional regulator family: C2H2 zinc finger and Fungal Specific TF [Penicillium roqueforti]|nr:transcriptional regulator family: C2H2 zinc finger and Fungal Specific TF [Penicillium roqueforti]KAI3162576.1 transcriptional regulator family: C2H2 zinc finger and Fungal Specific TF [Penicillium roqueforti]